MSTGIAAGTATPDTSAATSANTSTSQAQSQKMSTDKKSITLTFEGADDLALHGRIVDQADSEDRTPSVELLRFVRKHFPKQG